MTQLTQEEIRDELLSLFEEHEEDLVLYATQIEKIENDALESFDRKIISIKNKLVNDIAISDEELQKKYLEEIELLRKVISEDVESKIKELIGKQGS